MDKPLDRGNHTSDSSGRGEAVVCVWEGGLVCNNSSEKHDDDLTELQCLMDF